MRRKSKIAKLIMAEERDYDEENPKISSPSEIINGITFGEITVPKNRDGMIDGDDGDASSDRSAGWGDCDQSTSNGTADTGYTGANSTKNGSHQIPADAQSEESFNIAKKENRYVNNMRLIMFGLLIITTVMVAMGVYKFVANTERRDFESSYEDNSLKIYEALGSSMDTKLEAVDSLAMMMVSNAREKNETWPFTTLPDFASKAAKMRILSNAIALQQYQWIEEEQRTEWEQYAKANEQWVQEVIDVQRLDTTFNGPSIINDYDFNNNYSTAIRYSDDFGVENNTGPYTPTWQTYPALATGNFTAYNFNAIQHKTLGPGIRKVIENHRVVIGPVLNFEESKEASGVNRVTAWAQRHVSEDVDASEPLIRMLYPVLNTTYGAITVDEPNSNVVGILASSFFWKTFLMNILPFGERGMVVVFSNTCNQSFTYQINGHEAEYFGIGDQHDPQFDHMGYSKTFEEIGLYSSMIGNYGGLPIDEEFCAYTVSTYPSQMMKDLHHTNNPVIFTAVSVSIFLFTAILFMVFDALVQIRQRKVMTTAVKTTAIVSSLFPSNVRDRLLDDNPNAAGNVKKENDGGVVSMLQPTKTRLRTFLNDGEPASEVNKPIADLFTDTTVLFADIAGFTAWSSVREPAQVFTLLETVYGAFDNIAQRRGVFKVETIGDSYVAVTGLPDPRADHAVIMAKFAKDCRQQFNELCSILESKLGPETGDLRLRLGLHSGPVTAGVLRGQKSRFQLFGDTVNTAARMESTGKPNKIQVSQATADLLKKSKKLHWLQPREEMVEAKGKGLMMTYWVEPRQIANSVATTTTTLTNSTIRSGSIISSYINTTPATPASSDEKSSVVASSSSLPSTIHRGSPSTRVVSSTQLDRLISWNVDVMERLLKKIVSRRAALTEGGGTSSRKGGGIDDNWNRPHETMVLNEVKEVIKLPEYNSKYTDVQEDPDSIILEPRLRRQLREFVTAIAKTYDSDNPFHNFPHASHVAMSVAKLLSRIVAPDKDFTQHEQLHDHTYGITSDPLTQFACLFSALIHDADHPGVPNTQLLKEGTDLAQLYEGKCIAEQNSINIAWKILIEKKYTHLRNAICATRQEETRFRQLVVNAVCATDIMDKDLKRARNERWAKAFSTTTSSSLETPPPTTQTQPTRSKSIISSSSSSSSSSGTSYLHEQINRKATIVIEHIIQASDVAHTMQHWHIYIKWNERLYAEMYKAYIDGRSDSDPTDNWYRGEIGFFDHYIIPLAQKLSECGVFGVSSDEYLNYARMNRTEWEKKGKDVVAGYVKKYHQKSNRSNNSIVIDEEDKKTKSGTTKSSCDVSL